MKQLLFLLLFPCLALAQYTGNAGQKITLGEQTTADGLVYRGLAADTTRKPSVDTMAYILLDTNTNIIWQYKKATNNAWTRVGGSISSGVTGVLPVANGGTGSATQNFVDLTTTQSSIGGAKTFTSALSGTSASFSGTLGVTGNGSFGSYLGLNNRTTPIYSEQLTVGVFSVPKITLAQSGGYRWSTYIDATDAKYRIRYEDGSIDPLVIDRLGAVTFSSSVTARRFNANTIESGISSQYGSTNATNSYVSYIYNNSDIAYLGNGLSLFSGVNATDFGITTAISSNFIFGTNNLERMRIASGGEIYVAGTTDRGAYNLQVNGTGVWGAGAYVDGSDLNIKDNIQNLDSSLYLINLLAPVMYNYKEEYNKDESKQIGFIAQDVYNVLSNTEFSNAIVKSDGDTLSMAYSSFIPLLTKAIQEQQALIKALEQRILILENK